MVQKLFGKLLISGTCPGNRGRQDGPRWPGRHRWPHAQAWRNWEQEQVRCKRHSWRLYGCLQGRSGPQGWVNDCNLAFLQCAKTEDFQNTHIKLNTKGGTAITQWIHLCLPSCCPRFESQAHHLCFYQLKFEFKLKHVEMMKINRKRDRDWPI